MTRLQLTHPAVGETLAGVACVRERHDGTTRAGTPCLDVTLGNATGAIRSAKIWAEALPAWEGIQPGAGVHVTGSVQAGWNGRPPELAITAVRILAEDHPIRLELNPHCPTALEEREARTEALIDTIERPEAHALVRAVLDLNRTDWYTAPAAIGHHHAYIGGLSEHSLEVAEAAVALARLPLLRRHVDRDAVIIGALLHDAGKLREYRWRGTALSMSRDGLLAPHLTLGGEVVDEAVSGLLEAGSISRIDYDHVRHVQLSHHLTREWGSPVPPRTLEAYLIHLCDLVSARLNPLVQQLGDGQPTRDGWVESTGWRGEPLFDLAAALVAEGPLTGTTAEEDGRGSGPEDDGPGGGRTAPDISPEAEVSDPVPAAAETLILTAGDGPGLTLLELDADLTGYLAHLLGKDLSGWGPERRTRLRRDSIVALRAFLLDQLPEEMRQAVERKRAA
jgi:3'-5' exoribonuclease